MALVAVTISAYAGAILGESITVTVPEAWATRVRVLAPHCEYGPDYRRAVIESIIDIDLCVRDGFMAVAYDHLLAAERLADLNRSNARRP